MMAGLDADAHDARLTSVRRRFSNLTTEDYREAHRASPPPAELVIAVRLLRVLFEGDGSSGRESSGAGDHPHTGEGHSSETGGAGDGGDDADWSWFRHVLAGVQQVDINGNLMQRPGELAARRAGVDLLRQIHAFDVSALPAEWAAMAERLLYGTNGPRAPSTMAGGTEVGPTASAGSSSSSSSSRCALDDVGRALCLTRLDDLLLHARPASGTRQAVTDECRVFRVASALSRWVLITLDGHRALRTTEGCRRLLRAIDARLVAATNRALELDVALPQGPAGE